VKYCSKKGAYYVRCVVDGEQKTTLLERKFMEESVLLLDEEFIEQLKKKTSQVIMKLLHLSKKT
jgi:ABC-type lipoprotein export system ATPase subunit